MGHALERLVIGDEPDSWRAAGFTVHHNTVRFGKVEVELVGSQGQRGVLSWKLNNVDTTIDGLATSAAPNSTVVVQPARAGVNEHANAVFAIDHLVVETGDIDRTVAAFEGAGITQRRSTVFETPAGQRRQSFLWAGRVIIEVIGPLTPTHDKPASIWGLALVTGNLETTCQLLADKLSEPRAAVQPGRKIATLHTRPLDISVPVVILSPHVAELG